MNNLLLPLGLLIAVASLAGCGTRHLEVQSDYSRSYDFGKLRTWDWAPQGGTLETDAASKTAQRIQLDTLVKGHVEQALVQRAFTRVSKNPNVLVAWSFGEWELDRHNNPNGGYGAVGLMYPGLHASLLPAGTDGRAPPPSENPYSSKYEQAKLEIAVMDASTSKVIWNATVTDDSDFGYFKSSQRDRIGAAVDSLLSGFPPLAPGAP
ncbi:MAG: DUF4136 domain-containing protein [Methylococcaceae bacterium]|nr:DUF4136 domain-containing protein [Methylococcaceae bacterium]